MQTCYLCKIKQLLACLNLLSNCLSTHNYIFFTRNSSYNMASPTIKVIIPTEVSPMLTLCRNIVKKHNADGSNSVLPTFIMQSFIKLTNEASQKNEQQLDLKKQAELATERRNIILGKHESQNRFTTNTVLFYVTSIRDYLLGVFRGNERELGSYGFVVQSPKGDVRVEIPINSEELSLLAIHIVQKHQNNPDNSVIPLVLIDPLIALVAETVALVDSAAQLRRDAETATQSRNLLLGIARSQNSKTPNTLRYYLSSIRDILLGMYRGQEQRLGDWGFEVNASAAASNTIIDIAEVDDNTNDSISDSTNNDKL